MSLFALIWGICVFLGFCLALIPCLGWLNWVNIPAAIAGVIIGIVAMARANQARTSPGMAIAAIVLSVIAAVVGVVRLFLGGGVV